MKQNGLNKEEAQKILAPEGHLSTFLKGFEPRPQQIQMMGDIIDAYNNRNIALIEAGTGTGKSLAYLIPALLWQQKFSERTVISTNTINLQEQIIKKDLPLLIKALGINCKAVLVKGRSNYICRRKAEEVKYELPLMTRQELTELEAIDQWLQNTKDGSRSTLPIVPSANIWEKVCAEADTCNMQQCPHYNDCFFVNARQAAQEANLLVVNHHLLCSDLISKADDINPDNALLPDYTCVILDEAHHFEEVASEFFASTVSQVSLLKNLSRLSAERQGKPVGKLNHLNEKILSCYRKGDPKEVANILNRLSLDIPAQKWELIDHLEKAYEAFSHFSKLVDGSTKEEDLFAEEVKMRILPYHQTHPYWIEKVVENTKGLVSALEKFAQTLAALASDVDRIDNERLSSMVKSTLFDIRALTSRLLLSTQVFKDFISNEIPKNKVRWVELQTQRVRNTTLHEAKLDISNDLAKYLFNKVPTTVLVSATLTTNHKFDFIRKSLGLYPPLVSNEKVKEAIYEAPFNYKKQALFAIPTDISAPSHPKFLEEAIETIWHAIQASRGNAFILFTSYQMLKACFERLENKMLSQKFNPLKQGDTNRQALIEQFKKVDRSILFGTDSFWEGVDVVGEALRCVILVKLPFKVPSEPMTQARSEAILANKGDPFFEYSLPTAIVKFKQGFGRLIRNRKDRGCIICLDNRLVTKGYGKEFLNSLPDCQQLFISRNDLQKQMEEFYRQTFYLTKN